MWAYRQILLVGEDKEESVPQLVLVQHPLELLAGLNNTIAIVAVDDEDDSATLTAVAAVRAAERLELLAVNRRAAVATFAGADVQHHAVDES